MLSDQSSMAPLFKAFQLGQGGWYWQATILDGTSEVRRASTKEEQNHKDSPRMATLVYAMLTSELPAKSQGSGNIHLVPIERIV